MTIEAMKQALAALEQYTNVVTSTHDPNSWVTVADGGKPAREAITALRAAIEQAQEPVAWVGPSWLHPETRTWESESFAPGPIDGWTPLYTAPRQWQGLTDEDISVVYGKELNYRDGDYIRFARAIEAKLKEKNNG